MARTPPFDLDPHVAIRSPETLPALVINGMYKVFQKQRGELAERFIAAFNITCWSLTTAGRRKAATAPKNRRQKGINWQSEGRETRLIKGTLEIAPGMEKMEVEAKQESGHDQMKRFIVERAKRIYARNPDYYDKTWQKAHGY